jgi:hypothetical protein
MAAVFMNLHPDDLIFFNEVTGAMKRVAKQYDLPLRSITALRMPKDGMADRMGDCSSSGDIRLVMRCTVDGEFCEEPLSPEEVWETAAHELAHLMHMAHNVAHQEFTVELKRALQNQQMDHREKVLARLVKIQALRESEARIGNTAAAESFAQAINRMLIENELSPSDIDYARATDKDPVIQKRVNLDAFKIKKVQKRSAWQETFARIVAKAHLCSFLIRSGSNDIWFVGTESHATVAEYVYGTLVVAASRMCEKEYRTYRWKLYNEGGSTTAARGFNESWMSAFLKRIEERFNEARQAAVTEAPGGSSVALIRLDGALVKVRKYIDDKFASKKGLSSLSQPMGNNAAGRASGTAAANAMPIGRRGVTGGKTQRLIG